jgi:hypothetical protein
MVFTVQEPVPMVFRNSGVQPAFSELLGDGLVQCPDHHSIETIFFFF